jgi:hypothetical protein
VSGRDIRPLVACSAWGRGLGKSGCGVEVLSFDGAVDGGAPDAEEFGDPGRAVLATVHQGDEVGFLPTVELGLLAA